MESKEEQKNCSIQEDRKTRQTSDARQKEIKKDRTTKIKEIMVKMINVIKQKVSFKL
jgi:hypothetical protein